MKLILSTCLLLVILASFVRSTERATPPSPLAEFSTEWNDAKYLACNTATNANYLTAEEKKTIYILNMARMNPVLFANSVVKKYPDNRQGLTVSRNSHYYKSLLTTMLKLKPLNLLYPDSLCFKSALCHAQTTGKAGTVTHDRTTAECKKVEYYSGECCHYGYNTALDILLALLIDEGVESLGHREICLAALNKVGVSIQPHIAYRNTAVLDFKY